MTLSRPRLAVIAALAATLGCGTDKGVAGVLVVSTVEVTPGIATVVVGDTRQLTAAPKTASGIEVPGRTVVWSSLSPAIATVSTTGLVSGSAAGGPVTIRATVDGIPGDALVTVSAIPVSRVTVSPPSNPLVAGSSVQLTATAFDAGGATLSGRAFLWTSSDPTVAAVTTTGMVLAVSVGGPVTITATSEGKSGTATVTVSPRPADRLGFVQQPTTTTAGAPFSPVVKVAVQDNLLATVLTASNPITIALAANPGSATLSGTTTVNAVNGIAAFGNLTLNRAGAGYTFVVTSPNLTSAISDPFTILASGAGALVLATPPPATAQSGVVLTTQPAVRLVDGSGNTVTQAGVVITATLTSGAGTLGGGVTATTSALGVATFTTLSISGLAGSYTLGFSSPGLSGVNSGPIALTAGPAAVLAITTQPSVGAQSGVPLAQQPAIQIRDLAGNPVAQVGVVVTATLASGTGLLGGATTATTNASGLATFTSLAINGSAGPYTLQFAAPGLTPVVSGTITLGAGAATQIAMMVQPSPTAQVGVPFAQQPSVQLRDASNNPITTAGVSITVTASVGATVGGTATTTTNGSGVATFSGISLSGPVASYTLIFSASGLTSATSNSIALAAGPANLMVAISALTQSAPVGTAVPAPPSVKITDSFGNPVSGFAVSFAVTAGGGTVVPAAPATVSTNGSGIATTTSWTLGPSAGANTVTATAAVPSGSPLVFSATGTAGTATNIAANSATTQSAVAGTAVAAPPSVKVTDNISNPVQGVLVTFAVTGGGGSISGPAGVATDAGGIATVGGWTLGSTPGTNNNTLTASSGALIGSPVTFLASGTVGPASQLAITQQPVGGASGAALATQPIIAVRDAQGNTVTTDNTTQVTVAIFSGTGGLLGGTLTVTAVSGIATFTNLTLAGTAGMNYVLRFTSSPALTAVNSGNVAVSAGGATQLAITTQPVGGANGAALATQPVVAIRDAQNSTVTTDNTTQVSVAIFSGAGGTLGGTQTVTAVSGVATFTNLTLAGTVGVSYVLRFTSSPALTPVSSNNVTVTAGAATQLGITTQPVGGASGAALATQPIIAVRDAQGSTVTTDNSTQVSVAILSGAGGTLGGTQTVTAASGVATFTNLTLTGTVGTNYVLQFTSSPALTPVSSGNVTVSGGSATQLTYSIQPSTTAQSGVAFVQQPVLLVQDAGNNPVSGVVVTAVAPGGTSLVGTTTATSNGSGLATFTNLGLSGPVGPYTLSFTAGALNSGPSGTITLSAGPAFKLAVTAQPSATSPNDVPFAQQPGIQIEDAAGNPVSLGGTTVTAAIATGAVTLGGTLTATTDGSGLATFTDLKITGTVGTRTLSFSAGGLSAATSNGINIVAGAATQLTYSIQPSSTATDGVAFAQQPVLLLQDVSNNPVGSVGVTATITGAPGGVSLLGTTTVATDGTGHATFTNLELSGTSGPYTLTFTAGAVTSPASITITLTGAPTHLSITTQPPATATDKIQFSPQPVIQLRDAGDNPVGPALITITVSLVPSALCVGNLTGAQTADTNGSGLATFQNLKINGTGTCQLHFSATGLTGIDSDLIVVGP